MQKVASLGSKVYETWVSNNLGSISKHLPEFDQFLKFLTENETFVPKILENEHKTEKIKMKKWKNEKMYVEVSISMERLEIGTVEDFEPNFRDFQNMFYFILENYSSPSTT